MPMTRACPCPVATAALYYADITQAPYEQSDWFSRRVDASFREIGTEKLVAMGPDLYRVCKQ